MHSLLLAGAGKMGGALLQTWHASGLIAPGRLFVIEPQKVSLPSGACQVDSLENLPGKITPEIIVLAVKPQMMDALLPAYGARFGARPLYLSIAAGKTLPYLRERLGAGSRAIRVMPNLPAIIGQGMSVLCAHADATPQDKEHASALFKAAGEIAWIEDEAQMHAITALSGSGPAYLFLFAECMAQGAIALGLSEATARQLTLQTLKGSAALAALHSDSLESLWQSVASKGGTTEAALEALMREPGLRKLLEEAIRRAAERSRELGG